MNRKPMTQEELDTIQMRLGCDTSTTEDVCILLGEVERLRARPIVDEAMVERALRQSYGPKAWQEMCDSEDDYDVALVSVSRDEMWDTLNAALGIGEGA